MELIWLVLSLLVVDLAAFLFAVDTRPGFQHSAHPGFRHQVRPGLRHPVRSGTRRSMHG